MITYDKIILSNYLSNTGQNLENLICFDMTDPDRVQRIAEHNLHVGLCSVDISGLCLLYVCPLTPDLTVQLDKS